MNLEASKKKVRGIVAVVAVASCFVYAHYNNLYNDVASLIDVAPKDGITTKLEWKNAFESIGTKNNINYVVEPVPNVPSIPDLHRIAKTYSRLHTN